MERKRCEVFLNDIVGLSASQWDKKASKKGKMCLVHEKHICLCMCVCQCVCKCVYAFGCVYVFACVCIHACEFVRHTFVFIPRTSSCPI